MSKGISETAFASQVEDLLRLYHWRWCHFRPARTMKGWRTPLTGDKGLPDYIAVRPPRLIFAELKDEVKPTTPEQEAWLEDLRECMKLVSLDPLPIKGGNILAKVRDLEFTFRLPEVYLWRPSQFEEVRSILE